MRTTLTLEEDVAEKAKSLSARLRRPFKAVVNEALRCGLAQMEAPQTARPYRTEGRPMGLREGRNLDDIQGLLSQLEGETRW